MVLSYWIFFFHRGFLRTCFRALAPCWPIYSDFPTPWWSSLASNGMDKRKLWTIQLCGLSNCMDYPKSGQPENMKYCVCEYNGTSAIESSSFFIYRKLVKYPITCMCVSCVWLKNKMFMLFFLVFLCLKINQKQASIRKHEKNY